MHTITLDFENKLMEEVNICSMFKEADIINLFPFQLLCMDSSINSQNVCKPTVSYRYGDTIQRKILNYNNIIKSDEVPENITCNCVNSIYKDPHHKRVVTGNLNFIEDKDLRNLLGKGLNFRPPKLRNSKKAIESFKVGIEGYIKSLSKKYKVAEVIFDGWKSKLLENIKSKINKISTNACSNKKFVDTKVALQKLAKLQENFVFIPTDKSSNNISIVCKKFYLMSIKSELDSSFTTIDITPEEVINKQKKFLKESGIQLEDGCDKLSNFYASCKQHKNPPKFRYITSTCKAITKPLTRILKGVFKTIQKEVIRDCGSQDYRRKDNIKTCWIIDNNINVRKEIFKCNRGFHKAKSISSFDFDTLYTSIPHGKLKYVISQVVKNSFNSSGKKFIRVTKSFKGSFSDSDRKYKGTYILDEETIINLFNYMVDNCFILFKGKVYRQTIGIPMGIDPAPFIANLFLHYYENNYMNSLINSGNLSLASKLSRSFRYLDDLLGLNELGSFEEVQRTIYPNELILSRTDNLGKQANYLDLNLKCDNDFFKSSLYDKRDDFKFEVINFPCMKYSNIPTKPSYGIFLSQMIRICRNCTNVVDFNKSMTKIALEFLNKNFIKINLYKIYLKFIDNYEKEWCKFGFLPEVPTCLTQ